MRIDCNHRELPEDEWNTIAVILNILAFQSFNINFFFRKLVAAQRNLLIAPMQTFFFLKPASF